MPKVHQLGPNRFIQVINFPVQWGWRVAVRGETQEIEEPYRLATPVIVRLPFHKALVFGKWTGKMPDEESALQKAMQGRVLKDEDFEEGWTAPAYQATEEDFWDTY